MVKAQKREVGKKILVVDDEKGFREIVVEVLGAIPNVTVLQAETGMSALDQLKNTPVQAILTDVRMPGLDGMEFIAKTKELGFAIPIIICTGHANTEMAIQALRLGAFDFLEKPFQTEELTGIVNRALMHTESSIGSRLAEMSLKSRQIKITEMVMKGLTNREIAENLKLSEQAIKYHVGHLLKKFETTNRAQLREKLNQLVSRENNLERN